MAIQMETIMSENETKTAAMDGGENLASVRGLDNVLSGLQKLADVLRLSAAATGPANAITAGVDIVQLLFGRSSQGEFRDLFTTIMNMVDTYMKQEILHEQVANGTAFHNSFNVYADTLSRSSDQGHYIMEHNGFMDFLDNEIGSTGSGLLPNSLTQIIERVYKPTPWNDIELKQSALQGMTLLLIYYLMALQSKVLLLSKMVTLTSGDTKAGYIRDMNDAYNFYSSVVHSNANGCVYMLSEFDEYFRQRTQAPGWNGDTYSWDHAYATVTRAGGGPNTVQDRVRFYDTLRKGALLRDYRTDASLSRRSAENTVNSYHGDYVTSEWQDIQGQQAQVEDAKSSCEMLGAHLNEGLWGAWVIRLTIVNSLAIPITKFLQSGGSAIPLPPEVPANGTAAPVEYRSDNDGLIQTSCSYAFMPQGPSGPRTLRSFNVKASSYEAPTVTPRPHGIGVHVQPGDATGLPPHVGFAFLVTISGE